MHWRGRLYTSPTLLRFALAMGPSGLVAILAGWYTTEIGRQPWLIQGLMRPAEGVSPQTRHVRGSNHVVIGVFQDRLPGRAILVSVLDNLVKGASGQAVQNMNLMHGLPETMALEQDALFP